MCRNHGEKKVGEKDNCTKRQNIGQSTWQKIENVDSDELKIVQVSYANNSGWIWNFGQTARVKEYQKRARSRALEVRYKDCHATTKKFIDLLNPIRCK